LIRVSLDSFLAESSQVTLGNNTTHMLLVSCFLLTLAGLLLNATTRNFSSNAGLSSLKALSFNKLGIANFLIFLGLKLDYGKFTFFEDFHTCLFKSLLNEDIEHRFNFLVEVEKLVVTIVNLGTFATFFGGHTRLEQRHWRAIKIKFCSDAD
jgi:hypothetical protein